MATTFEFRTLPAAAEAWLREDVPVAPRSYLADVRARLFRNRAGVVSLIVLGVLVLLCLGAPLLSPYDPNVGEVAERLQTIGSPGHILGTDDQGRDMLSRLLWGGQLSLLAGFAPVLVATAIGTALGAFAGYTGGAPRSVLMRSLDMFYGLPAILLAIAIAASLGPGLTNVIISVSIVYIAPLARVAESATQARHGGRVHRGGAPEWGEHTVDHSDAVVAEYLQSNLRLRGRAGGLEHDHCLQFELPGARLAAADARMGIHAEFAASGDLRESGHRAAAGSDDLHHLDRIQHAERCAPRLDGHQGFLTHG
jgi:hypothetical protein